MLRRRARKTFRIWFIFLLAAPIYAQGPTPAGPDSPDSSQTGVDTETAAERWNLYYQATSIGDYHGKFRSPYQDATSLKDYPERDVSLTTTLFFTWRLEQNTFLVFDPEIAGGKGFSGVNGIADQPNGEIPRVASATPKPYIARLFIQHDFGFGSAKEHQESDENQLAGDRPVNRYSIYAGRFTVSDYFDNNNYTHDPRMQFMAWGVMYNGAWDYPADTRGYTWGIVQEANTRNWSFRWRGDRRRTESGQWLGSSTVASSAITARFGKRNRRYALRDWAGRSRAGAVRVLAYDNREQGGNYGQALALAARNSEPRPTVDLHRDHVGTLKYGTGLSSFDQAITNDLGMSHSPRMERRQDPELRVSRPSTAWRVAESLLKAHTGTERVMWSRLRLPRAGCPPCTGSIWRLAGRIF